MALSELQSHRCAFCYVRFRDDGVSFAPNSPTLEHLIALSRLGADHPDNMVMSCWKCNNKRGIGYDEWCGFGVTVTMVKEKPADLSLPASEPARA